MTDLARDEMPWKNGNYWCKDQPNLVFFVEGENATAQNLNDMEGILNTKESWKYGDFGETHPAIAEMTGKSNYNVKMSMVQGHIIIKGVLRDDGKSVTFWSSNKEVASYIWIDEEELEKLRDSGDPVDAPSSHYKIQPEKSGKLLFISGPPGLGKSTTALFLSKLAGYVYYEGDCFLRGVNPYIPPDAKEPSIYATKQTPLKGLTKARIQATKSFKKEFKALNDGAECDLKGLEGFYVEMCKDVARERNRMGGDWVVPLLVPLRSLRDAIRAQLGPDLVFVVLNISKEDQEKRLVARHGDMGKGAMKAVKDIFQKLFDVFEPAADDEENVIDLVVTDDMKPGDVVEKILNSIK